MSDQNKSVLQRGAEAFNNIDDRTGWFDIHDADVVAHGLAPESLGLSGLKQFYNNLWRAFPDLQISIEDVIAENDKVGVRLIASGTHKAEFNGVPATGTEVKFAVGYIFRFGNGKIVERWTNIDRLGLMVQLGAIPVPA